MKTSTVKLQSLFVVSSLWNFYNRLSMIYWQRWRTCNQQL